MLKASTRVAEFQNGLSATLVGVFLLLPLDTFGSAAGYRWFAGWAPESVWGIVFLMLGLTQIIGAAAGLIVLRRLGSSLLAILFAIYLTGFLFANPVSAAIPFVAPMVLTQGWAFFRVRRVP